MSCVDQGLWTYKSDVFSSKNHVMSPLIRWVKARDVNALLPTTDQWQRTEIVSL